MNEQPQAEHQWLDKLVGTWTVEAQCDMGPDKPQEKFVGRETVRSLGGLWVLCEGEGDTPGGGKMLSIMTIGYDPGAGLYRGTFIASMMTHLWIYEGKRTGERLPLDTLGPDFGNPGVMQKYQDVIEFIDDDHRTLTAYMSDGQGGWREFMKSHLTRVK